MEKAGARETTAYHESHRCRIAVMETVCAEKHSPARCDPQAVRSSPPAETKGYSFPLRYCWDAFLRPLHCDGSYKKYGEARIGQTGNRHAGSQAFSGDANVRWFREIRRGSMGYPRVQTNPFSTHRLLLRQGKVSTCIAFGKAECTSRYDQVTINQFIKRSLS